MAIDTRQKRDSAIAVTSPWRSRLPAPDTITQADRQHVAYVYSGILAEAFVDTTLYSCTIYLSIDATATLYLDNNPKSTINLSDECACDC